MENELLLFTGYAIELVAAVLLSRFKGFGLTAFVVANMLLISVYAQKQIDVFGIETNVGNIFYAAVFFGMSCIYKRHGTEKTIKAINATFISLILFVVLGQLSLMFPIISYNSEAHQTLASLYAINVSIVTASFVAFYASTVTNCWVLTKTKDSAGKIVANIVGQAVDSAIFFPIAFANVLTSQQILTAAIGGFMIKSLLNIIDTPVYKWLR